MISKITHSLLGVVALAATMVMAVPAGATVESTLYASPTGTGAACSSTSPCSLTTAKSQAETIAPTATGDINVVLGGGTYALSSTLTFTSADSPANGYTVSYAAAPGANVVFSGGTPVTGSWSLHDSSKNVWEAPLPSGALASTRQIYVNGVRSGIDTQNSSQVFGSMTQTSTGYTYTATGPNSWTNTANVDLVYPGNESQNFAWADSLCPASSVSSGVITMASPCYALGTDGTTSNPATDTKILLGTPAAVQDNYALLGQPGQFYIDASANEIYYVPRSGENMSTASVIVPALQTLLAVNGTAASPVSNFSFQGIHFEYGAWTFGNQGVLDYQANDLFGSSANVDAMLPANVACHSCSDVTFSGDTFTHLGGAGLSLDGGGTNNAITGNIFTDISANGVEIGTGGGPMATEPATLESGDIVNDNEVYNVANEYLGGVGIYAGWVKNTTIDHNEVWDTSYTGISLGWGWGFSSYGSTEMVNNQINDNYVHNVMNSGLEDGGAIYVNGTEQSSPASQMEGNYVSEDSQEFGALYLDNGSSYWTVENNVVGAYAPYWSVVQANAPTANYNTVENNFVAASVGGVFGGGGTNTVASNTTGLSIWPSAANAVISAAGLEAQYQPLNGGAPQTNLALNRPVIVSSSWSGLATSQSNDGSASSVWGTASGDSAPSWQVDLGASYPLTDVQILFRTDGYAALSDTTNLKILVSNSPSLTSGYTVACATSTTPLPSESRLDCPTPTGTWRYVSILKTDGTELIFSEARVFGDATGTIVDDLNPAVTYTGSWTVDPYPGQYGGTQTYTTTNGDSLSYTFTGTGIDYTSSLASNRGSLTYSVDGGTSMSGSCYSATPADRQVCFGVRGLTYGTHTLNVTKTGGTYLTLDALRVYSSPPPATFVDDANSAITYTGTWIGQTGVTVAYNGTQTYTTTNGDSLSYTFTGTGIDFISTMANNRGSLTYSVDGGTSVSGSCYAATSADRQICFGVSGLAYGTHTLQVTKTSGTYFTLDAFEVLD